jgi:hypothetical protein
MTMKRVSLLLVFIIAALPLAAETGDKEKYSTRKIDVAVKDEEGLSHYLVFEKVKAPGLRGGSYSVAFYMNDLVQIDPGAVWSLLFRTEEANYAGKLLFGDNRGANARVLHFEMEEESLEELSGAKGIRIRMLFATGDAGNFRFVDYDVASEAALKKAMAAILSM